MGAIVNGLAILVASLVGVFLGKAIPDKLENRLMQGIGLAVMTMGIQGAIQGQETLVMILSMVVGIIIGEGLDIDGRINRWVYALEDRLIQDKDQASLANGFLSASMIFCVGSMAIIGSLESGLTGDNTTLYTKSIMDGITAMLLSSSLGWGVALSAIPIILYQGVITLFAGWLAPFLDPLVIQEVSAVGSILLIAMGLNMLKLTNIKIMNMTPAMFLPIIIMQFMP